MSYPSDRQLARAIRTLLYTHRLEHYWDTPDIGESGPGPQLFLENARIQEGTSSLGRGEQIILRICLDLWSQSGGVSLAEILQNLDSMIAYCIGELMMALGEEKESGALDQWIAKWKDFDAKASLTA